MVEESTNCVIHLAQLTALASLAVLAVLAALAALATLALLLVSLIPHHSPQKKKLQGLGSKHSSLHG